MIFIKVYNTIIIFLVIIDTYNKFFSLLIFVLIIFVVVFIIFATIFVTILLNVRPIDHENIGYCSFISHDLSIVFLIGSVISRGGSEEGLLCPIS